MSSRYFRPQVLIGHVLVLVAALTCLRLGWWQWSVFEASRGTGQNLGYALLWPVFAGSFIYMWLRFLQLESTRDVDADPYADDAAADAIDRAKAGDTGADLAESGVPPHAQSDTAGSGTAGVVKPTPTEPSSGTRHTRSSGSAREAFTVGMGYVSRDDDDDPELAAYNRALAQLAEEDERRAR